MHEVTMKELYNDIEEQRLAEQKDFARQMLINIIQAIRETEASRTQLEQRLLRIQTFRDTLATLYSEGKLSPEVRKQLEGVWGGNIRYGSRDVLLPEIEKLKSL